MGLGQGAKNNPKGNRPDNQRNRLLCPGPKFLPGGRALSAFRHKGHGFNGVLMSPR